VTTVIDQVKCWSSPREISAERSVGAGSSGGRVDWLRFQCQRPMNGLVSAEAEPAMSAAAQTPRNKKS